MKTKQVFFPKKWSKWTDKEKRFLRENRSSMNQENLSSALGRTKYAIVYMCNKDNYNTQACRNSMKNFNISKDKKILSDYERGFVVGLLEGEGCISIRNSGRKRTLYALCPTIDMCNTDKSLVVAFSDILRKINIHSKIHVSHNGNTKARKAWRIVIQKTENVMMLLREIGDDFVSEKNKKRSKLLWTYCMSKRNNIIKGGKNAPTTEKEIDLYYLIRKLNMKGVKNKEVNRTWFCSQS